MCHALCDNIFHVHCLIISLILTASLGFWTRKHFSPAQFLFFLNPSAASTTLAPTHTTGHLDNFFPSRFNLAQVCQGFPIPCSFSQQFFLYHALPQSITLDTNLFSLLKCKLHEDRGHVSFHYKPSP